MTLRWGMPMQDTKDMRARCQMRVRVRLIPSRLPDAYMRGRGGGKDHESTMHSPELSNISRTIHTASSADRKSTRLNSSHSGESRMPSSA